MTLIVFCQLCESSEGGKNASNCEASRGRFRAALQFDGDLMTELLWFLFGAWAGASLLSVVVCYLFFKLKPWTHPE